ncbi:hypothetical protein ACFX11_003347 [Malus domestica]
MQGSIGTSSRIFPRFPTLCRLLQKDVPFKFDEEFESAFKQLKEKLTSTLIIVPPDWSLPFKLMCDASNYALGAV